MFNNRLLLMNGRKRLEGIFEISVGHFGSYFGASTSYGSIVALDKTVNRIEGTNSEYFPNEIKELKTLSSPGTDRTFLIFSDIHRPNLRETTIYVHLKKENSIVSKIFTFDLNDVQSIDFAETGLFTSSDNGKTYRMYVGCLNTLPPVAISHSSLSSSSSYWRVA